MPRARPTPLPAAAALAAAALLLAPAGCANPTGPAPADHLLTTVKTLRFDEPPAWPADELAALEARKALVLATARERLLGTGRWTPGDPPTNTAANDLGKHWWPRLLAELAADPTGASVVAGAGRNGAALTVRELARGLVHNTPLGPDSDVVGYLYFSPVGLGAALHAAPQLFDGDDLRTVCAATFRFDPAVSGLNLRTGEGTENHILMGRAGGYLIADFVLRRGPDDPVTGEFFAEATAWEVDLRGYLLEFARLVFEKGTGEWDSSTYYPYVAACWLVLFDHARDERVRAAARASLDWLASTVALRTSWGVFGGPEQRGGGAFKALESNTDHLAWLWFPTVPEPHRPPFRKQDFSQCVYAALSAYRPPAEALVLARKAGAHATGQVVEHKPSYLIHGADSRAAESRVDFAHRPEFSLGLVTRRPTGGWAGGDAQDILWKLVVRGTDGLGRTAAPPPGRHPWQQVAGDPAAGIWVDLWHHPQDADAQQAALRALYLDGPQSWRERWERDYRERFPGDRSRENPVNFRAVYEGRVQPVFFVDGDAALTDGANARGQRQLAFDLGPARLLVAPVGPTAVAVERDEAAGRWRVTGDVPLGSLGGFALAVATSPGDLEVEGGGADPAALVTLTLAGQAVGTARYGLEGEWTEPLYNWGYGPTLPGGFREPAMPPFTMPAWPTGPGQGRVAAFAPAPPAAPATTVYAAVGSGGLQLSGRRLRLGGYEVDWSGPEPVFRVPPPPPIP